MIFTYTAFSFVWHDLIVLYSKKLKNEHYKGTRPLYLYIGENRPHLSGTLVRCYRTCHMISEYCQMKYTKCTIVENLFKPPVPYVSRLFFVKTRYYCIIVHLLYSSTVIRCTRTTSAIISQNDTTLMKCNIRPNCESFKNCFYYRTMVMWNRLPCNIRQTARISLFKSKLTKFLWTADNDWPD